MVPITKQECYWHTDFLPAFLSLLANQVIQGLLLVPWGPRRRTTDFIKIGGVLRLATFSVLLIFFLTNLWGTMADMCRTGPASKYLYSSGM